MHVQPADRYLTIGDILEQKVDDKYYLYYNDETMNTKVPRRKIRIHNPTVEQIQPYLRYWLSKSRLTIAKLERIYGNMAPHHWFEKMKFASLPGVDDWIKLKELLNFDDTYDQIMTEYRWMTEWEIMKEHKLRHKSRYAEKTILDKSSTLTAFGKSVDVINLGYAIRKITPIECERLQTLPDNYTKVDGISELTRYKCIGNGWTVNVISHIFESMK
jgi:site-specific DNA-cytosine methylase